MIAPTTCRGSDRLRSTTRPSPSIVVWNTPSVKVGVGHAGQNVGKARAIHGRFMNRVRDHAPVHIEQDEPPGDGLGEVLHRVVQVDRGLHVAILTSISYAVSKFSRESS